MQKKCECGKPIANSSTFCKSCWQLGSRNPQYGKHALNYQGSLNYCCMDCGNLISKPTALRGKGRCRSCSRSGNLSWNKQWARHGIHHHSWKGGLPVCIDCGKKLSFYTCKRCVVCDRKYRYTKPKYRNNLLKSKKYRHIKYNQYMFRSSWEHLFAKWLDYSNIKWQYEPKAFLLKVNNSPTTYTPDFYLPEFDIWIEIKGWMRPRAKLKILEFSKNHFIKVFSLKEFDEILGCSKRALNYYSLQFFKKTNKEN